MNTNYPKILKQLKEWGIHHHHIVDETSISYKTLRKLRDGEVTNPKVSTHKQIHRIYNREWSIRAKIGAAIDEAEEMVVNGGWGSYSAVVEIANKYGLNSEQIDTVANAAEWRREI